MDRQHAFTLQRFEVFARDVLAGAVYREAAALEIGAAQFPEPVSYEEAAKAKYKPVRIGWEWGPSWSTCWFKLRGRVPSGFRGERVMVRFSSDTEALLWRDGVPHHGLDANRDAAELISSARGGERVEVLIEAACNHMFGDRGLQWDGPEIHRRWNSDTPGRLDRAEIAVFDESARRLLHLYRFAHDLAKDMPPESARAQQMIGVLRRATNLISDDDVSRRAGDAVKMLEEAIGVGLEREGVGTRCHAVGHAHIDTAWLWPIRETKRKCHRTFANVLRNMEKYPGFKFLCSQAQQYAWVEETSPKLFAQIKRRVMEGRWEPEGGMWIEPDCTAPSGESLIRQVLQADRYWRGKFGDKHGAQEMLYLPDTFGFPACLPLVMKLCGLKTFVTNKLHWNQTNEFPHTTFWWRGLGGAEVLAHQTPGMDYNATNTPRELRRGEATHRNKDIPSVEREGGAGKKGARLGGARWLQPFGYGDGGGGPTDWSIEYAKWAGGCEGLPRVELSSARTFCGALHEDAKAARQRGDDFPTWEGELYLEAHRGTYTTHARLKQANKRLEELLRQAEMLMFAGPRRLDRKKEQAAKAELDRAWRLLLLNQFHDILPGSSIGWVYEDASRDHAEVERIAQRLIDEGLERWAAALGDGASDTRQSSRRRLYFNPMSHGAWMIDDRAPRNRKKIFVPGLSVSVRGAGGDEGSAEEALSSAGWHGPAVSVDGLTMANGVIRVRLDRLGRIAGLWNLETQEPGDEVRNLVAGRGEGGEMNELALYEDRPRMWDAWDIDAEYAQKRIDEGDVPVRMRVIEKTPERAAIRFERKLGRRSRVEQTYVLEAERSDVRVETVIDWREEHRLLRALFPTRVRASRAIFGTQLGWIERATDVNTSWQQAAFEVPTQRFMHVSDADGGVSVAFEHQYGASCRARAAGSEMGLSLLRSSRYPDPTADVGLHRFSYAIVTGGGTSAAEEAAERLARGPRRIEARVAGGWRDEARLEWSPMRVEDEFWQTSRVECVKLAEDGKDLIVRVCDFSGGRNRTTIEWGFQVKKASAVDALERPIERKDVRHDRKRNVTKATLKPFDVLTLRVERA